MGFEYDLGAKVVRISDEELRAGLRAFARRVKGRRFGVREFAAWRGRPFGHNTVIRRFGSWRAALSSIGIQGGRARNYGAAELVEELERVWREMGRPPGERSVARIGRYSKNAYKKRWGTVRRLCEMVARHHRGEISREEVLRGEVLRADGGDTGKMPVVQRKTIPVDVRWRVLKRDGYKCVACGRSPAKGDVVELNIDHVRPVCRGGGNEEGNLRTLCRDCNVGRGAGIGEASRREHAFEAGNREAGSRGADQEFTTATNSTPTSTHRQTQRTEPSAPRPA